MKIVWRSPIGIENGATPKPTIDPLLKLLVSLMVFFSFTTLWVATKMSSDGQTFQVMSGCLVTILGYFGGLIKGRTEKHDEPPPPGTNRSTVTVENAATPPVAPLNP